MSEPIYGVVPNFSEGRRVDVMDAICDALQVPGAHLVYRQADADHNRLDTTVLGEPRRPSAAPRSRAPASRPRLIDMDAPPRRASADGRGRRDPVHAGARRRDGTTASSWRARWAQSSRDVLDLPVYLYDRAALLPERASLAEVRKGEYEGLREAVRAGRAAARPRPARDRDGRAPPRWGPA